MWAAVPRGARRGGARPPRRWFTSLPSNRHIKVFQDPSSPHSHILTYLERDPPLRKLAIGTTTALPPTPQSFTGNADFVDILTSVVEAYGAEDEDVLAQARAYASPGGVHLASHGSVFPPPRRQPRTGDARSLGVGSASGAGGGGRGGFVHLSDRRNPPDYGRIAWPEDILASVEVDEQGRVVGKAQPSGTYRVVTNEGILGLSPFLRQKLVQRLEREQAREQGV